VVSGVVVDLERFEHFEGVNDRENHIFVDVLCVRGQIRWRCRAIHQALENVRLPFALVPDLTFPAGIKLNS
jgi:hypothetical protein